MSCNLDKNELDKRVVEATGKIRQELLALKAEGADMDVLMKMSELNRVASKLREVSTQEELETVLEDLGNISKAVEVAKELAEKEAKGSHIPTGEVVGSVRFPTGTETVKSVWDKKVELYSGSSYVIGEVQNAEFTAVRANGENIPAVTVRFKVEDKFVTYTFRKGNGGVSEPVRGYSKAINPPLVSKLFEVAEDIAQKKALERLKGTSSRDVYLGSEKHTGEISGTIENYVHGDVSSMVGIVDKLQEVGNKKADQQELGMLKQLLQATNPSWFYKTELMLDRAAKTIGQFKVKATGEHVIGLKLGTDKALAAMSTQMSDAAVYVHEVIHSMTAFALRSDRTEVKPLVREVRYAYEVAKKNTTWQDMLGKSVEEATPTEIKAAKEVYSYVFENESIVDDEFIAHALTYQPLVQHLSKLKVSKKDGRPDTIVQRVMGLLFDILDVVLGNFKFNERNNTVLEQVVNLTYRLGELNHEAELKVKDKENLLQRLGDWVNEVDQKASGLIKAGLDKAVESTGTPTPRDPDAPLAVKLVNNAKFAAKAMINPEYRKAFGLTLSQFGLKPEGTVREFFRDMFEVSDINKTAQWLGLASDKVDKMRQARIDAVKMAVMDSFSKEPTELEQVALTDVLVDTNLTSLVGNEYSWEQLQELLENGVEQEVEKAVEELRSYDPQRANWLENQAVGLGYYMATHQASIAQNLSARNIASYSMLEVVMRDKPDEVLQRLVNKVAVLTALRHTDKVSKDTLVAMIGRERAGLDTLVEVYEAFKVDSEEVVSPVHRIDGYSKEIFDEGITLQVAPIEDKKAMEAMGLKPVKPLSKKGADSTQVELWLYASSVENTAERQKGAIRTNVSTNKGTTLRSIKYMTMDDEAAKAEAQKDIARTDVLRKKLTLEMSRGKVDLNKVTMGLTPVLGKAGNVVDYRYMMSKKDKAELLQQNRQVSDVLARSFGQLVDKVETKEHNKKVLDVLKGYMESNWEKGTLGKDGVEEFVVISPVSEDPKIVDIYYQLPEVFRDYIDSREDMSFAVPREVMNLVFGYRHMQLSDMWLLNMTPASVKAVMDMVEGFWVDLVKIYRGNIVLKMPYILVQNLLSNIQYAIVTLNLNPFDVIKEYKESFQSIKEYLNLAREVEHLKVEIRQLKVRAAKGNTDAATKVETQQKVLDRKVKLLESSPLYADIVNTGIHQAIQEDVNAGYVHTTNKVEKKIGKLTDKFPSMVKEGLSILYLDKTTTWYKVNQEILQISDLIGRDVQNRRMKREEIRQVNGEVDLPDWWVKDQLPHLAKRRVLVGEEKVRFMQMAEKVRRYDLLQNFINYSKPSGRLEEWANRVGLLLFTKYLKRIQHVIVNSAVEHPIKSLAMMIAGGTIVPGDGIMHQALLARYLDDNPMGIGGVVPVYSPLEILGGVMMPGLIKEDTYKPLL